jgi:hypothetical protein
MDIAKLINRVFHGARFISVVVLGLLGVGAANAQILLYPDSSAAGDDLDGTDHVYGDAFAVSADTWDDWLFVGAPRETTWRDGFDQQDGAVYIYRKIAGTYVYHQKLTMPGSSDLWMGVEPLGDRFGSGVEAAAGWLFVGAVNDQDFPGLSDPREGLFHPDDPPFQFAGQVHVYALNGSNWDFVQSLISPIPGTNGSFGSRTQASHIALDSKGETAVIGEFNNFPGGAGQLHTYRLIKGRWVQKETIDAPFVEIDNFGDDLVFANDKYLIAGADDTSDDGLTNQGYVFVYERKDPNKPGKFHANPVQMIAGPVVGLADCGMGGFGQNGLDAAGGVVVIADPCVSGTAGIFAGAVSVYRLSGGTPPLVFEEKIEGDEPHLYFGSNWWGSRNAVAVSDSGERILIGSPMSPNGFLDDGADVRVYVDDDLNGWTEEFNLSTLTQATEDTRALGDTVFFVDDETAFVRENNFISPVVTGRKGQGFFYDLTSRLCKTTGAFCGGIPGVPCPADQFCADDVSDSCNRNEGGADCPGVCVYGSLSECPRMTTVSPLSPYFTRFEGLAGHFPSDLDNNCQGDGDAAVSGCYGEVCSAELEVDTTCEALDEYPIGNCICINGETVWGVDTLLGD